MAKKRRKQFTLTEQRSQLISSTIQKLHSSTQDSKRMIKAFGLSVEEAYVILTGAEFENLLETWLEVRHLGGEFRKFKFSGDNPAVLKAVCEDVCDQMGYALDRCDKSVSHAVVIIRKDKNP